MLRRKGFLDHLLGGGLPPNFATALTSPPCDERDMLIRNFLETGAKKGEPTFYLTIDPSLAGFLPQGFPSNFYLFVCNPQAETVVKSSLNVFLLKGVENLTNISIALTSAIRKLGPSQKTPRGICISLVLRRFAAIRSSSDQTVVDRTSHPIKVSRIHDARCDRPTDAPVRTSSRYPRTVRRRSQYPRGRNRWKLGALS